MPDKEVIGKGTNVFTGEINAKTDEATQVESLKIVEIRNGGNNDVRILNPKIRKW